MRIVLVGDGKVGRNLVKNLTEEDHDIVVIDNDPEVIDEALNTLDIVGVCGNGTSYKIQLEAGVDKADLVIATMDSDELNMLCCLIARKLGAKHTIARVRNPEYSEQLNFMHEELGLSMHLNPEYSTADELFRILRLPAALKVETFSAGRVEMVELRLKEQSVLNGVQLKDIQEHLGVKVLICAVERDEEVFIPGGNFTLADGDKINFVGTPANILRFLQTMGYDKKPLRDATIIGGSHIAYYLGRMLSGIGIQVKIIEHDHDRCLELSELLPKAMIIHGDGTDQDLLLEEGLDKTDAVITLTGMDEQNILVSMYATSLNVKKVLTKVNRAALASLVMDKGLDIVVSPQEIIANRILTYVRGMQNSLGSNVETLHRMVSGKVEALEFRVRSTFSQTGKMLRNLTLKENTLIACITRGNKIIIPFGDDTLQAGDLVIVVTSNQHYDDLNDILKN